MDELVPSPIAKGVFTNSRGQAVYADGSPIKMATTHPISRDMYDRIDYSQNGESLVIAEIFQVLGIHRGHAVEFGAGNGRDLSNTRNLTERGWSADLYDGDPQGSTEVKQAWIDMAWASKPVPQSCNFLSIDIDGIDYWILDALLGAWRRDEYDMPDLVLAEYNPIHERNDAVTIPYDPAHRWNNDTWYGASLAAFEQLATKHGYTLIRTHAGINAFLLRDDHAKAHPELIRPIEYRVKKDHRAHDPSLQWITL